MHERARDHSVDAIKTGETAKPGVPDDAAPKRRARMPQEASSQARPYPSNPPKPAPHRPGFGRGRSLPTGAGRSLRVFPYARSLRHRLPPLATQHAGKIGSRFQSVERKVTQHFIASMSVRLHRIRCSACSGFGVHDGWNTHLHPVEQEKVVRREEIGFRQHYSEFSALFKKLVSPLQID